MPIPVPVRHTSPEEVLLLPPLSLANIDAARMSSWYPMFRHVTFPTTIIDLDDLGEKEDFIKWLDSDSIFMPIECEFPQRPGDGSEIENESDEEDHRERSAGFSQRRNSGSSSSSSASSEVPRYSLSRLTAAIEKAIRSHGGRVFPKLNWTSPRDAAFIIPQTPGPLCCTSAADIYLLLKSSDLIQHGLDPVSAYEGSTGSAASLRDSRDMRIELVLRSFLEMNPSREVRCFVRNNILLGISQRDTNYYEHFQPTETRRTICETVRAFWEDELWKSYRGGEDYVFDLYLSADFDSAILVDINPYRLSTDPLLFTYPALLEILETALKPPPENTAAAADLPRLPMMRVITSRSDPLANSAAPAFGTNMMPVEMVQMSQGRSVPEFAEAWAEAVARGMQD